MIGGANVDIKGQAEGEIRPFDSNVGQVRQSAGGVGRNIAENLARLGASTSFITVLGLDAHGEWLAKRSREVGVDLSGVVWTRDGPTSTYVVIIDQRGEMQLAINDMGILEFLTPDVLRARMDLMAQADIIVLDCNLSEDSLAFIFHHFGHKKIYVDPVSGIKSQKVRPYLKNIYAFKPNKGEAEALSGIKIRSKTSLTRASNWFYRAGVKNIFISLGLEGLYFKTSGAQGLIHLPTSVISKNSTGAGDALMAGLVIGQLQHKRAEQAARLGISAAVLNIMEEETVSPGLTLAVLEQMYARYFN